MEKMQLSYSHFVALARNMHDPRFPNVHPLCRFLFEKPSVEKAFLYLIYWLPKSKRADGSIYKSAAELAHQTGYCARTMERVRKALETMGFIVYVKKANGAPTNHYRLDVEKFLQFVAEKLKTTIEQVYAWMANARVPAKPVQSEQAQMSESEQGETAPLSETAADTSRSESSTDVGVQESDKTGAPVTVKNTPLKADRNEKDKLISPAQATFRDRMVDRFGEKRSSFWIEELEQEIVRMSQLINTTFEEVEGWIKTYGFQAVNNYTLYASQNSYTIRHLHAWIRRALESEYKLKDWRMRSHSMDYSAGKYADFIHC
jgi:hypothetical protein